VSSDGRKLAYELIDAVPPWRRPAETIIFHHGIAVDRHLWSEWMPALVSRYRLVIFDMYGCGESRAQGGPQDWSAENRVDDVLSVADAVDASAFHVVGESYGGTIALMTGHRAPRRVTSVAICNAAHVGSSIQSVNMWEAILDEFGVKGWSDHMMSQRFFTDALSPEMRSWYSRQQAAQSKESILQILNALLAVDLANDVSRLQMPVLLLHGDASPFISVELMADLHRRLPNSEMQVFAHARHGLPFSHARQCSEALVQFLDRAFTSNVRSEEAKTAAGHTSL
jgi:pimeloyl-ACP methyl ester carboxylesterase